MPVRRFSVLCIALSACSSSPAPDSVSDGGASTSAEQAALPESDFTRPWVFLDGLSPDRRFNAVIRVPGGFVAVTSVPTNDGKAMPTRNNIGAFSPDGLTWEQHPLGDTVHARALAAGNGVIVAVGQRFGAGTRGSIVTSIDGKSWQEVAAPDVGLMSLRFLAGQFWAFGEQGAFFTSRDGQTWANQSRPASGQLNDIAFGKGRYVVVGNAAWLSSADGLTWQEQRSICPDLARCPGVVPPGGSPTGFPALFSVVFGNGTFVTDGAVGPWISSDGLTWTEAPMAVGGSVFSHGRFIARDGARGAVVVSDDGRAWAARTTFVTTDRNSLSCLDHTCVVFPDGILLVPGAADPAAIPRPPVLDVDNTQNGQTITATLDQQIVVYLKTIGPGQYGDPQLSSPAVRLVSAGFSPGPPDPGGPAQVFRLVADSPGRAQLHISHTGMSPPFDLTIDVGP